MGFLLVAIALVPLSWMASNLWALYLNYQAARTSGLPILICPFDPENVFYMIISVPLRPVFERILPAAFYDAIKVTIFGWEFRDKHHLHDRLGPAFILVTTAINQLQCADPAMAQVILARRKDFVQSPTASKVMNFLGENIVTADGESWSRQRRIVAPSLNERISEVVWKESAEQANQMAGFMLGMPKGESRDTIEGLRVIAINVLGQVVYGQPKPFGPMELPRDPDSSMSYIDAISLCTQQLVVAALVPARLLRLPVMPKTLQTVGAALHNLPNLTKNMLHQERRRNASGAGAPDNIMSMLVRLSDQEKDKGHDKLLGRASQYLTEDEIAGNLFVFTAAGFDTTANTMAYAITLLAAYPEWQLWIQDELDLVLGAHKGSGVPEYSTTFPKLTRCLALMVTPRLELVRRPS
ncbi:cytochrome P450 CYP13A3 [Fusarium oxysporum f. sp. phaseoli]